MPDTSFVHALQRPDTADGSVLVLLHGTGGDESDLMPLAARIAPRAVRLGLRGRSLDEGAPRWFRRLAMDRFDQAQIRSEATDFTEALDELMRRNDLDPARATFVGYSNGANFIGALIGLYPSLVRRAILMRAMPALDPLPATDLEGCRVLMLTGTADPYGRYAPALADWLERSGAALDHRMLAAGHGLAMPDLEAAQDWITQAGSVS